MAKKDEENKKEKKKRSPVDEEDAREVVDALTSEREAIGRDETTGASDASFEQAHGGGVVGTPAKPGGPPRRRDLSVDPDELGRRVLEDATGDLRPEGEEREETPDEALHEDEMKPKPGEARMREEVFESPVTEDRLTQEMPNRSEVDDRISQKARREQAEGEPPTVPEERGRKK
jgi:hypothetical protein